MTFGQTEQQEYILSNKLVQLEEYKDTISPLQLVREGKTLLADLRNTPRWEGSRSDISASFQTLFSDQETLPYLSYTDISSRTTALIAWGATQLSQAEAEAEGVGGFRRSLSKEAVGLNLDETQRLSSPGGLAWEVARETPAPLVEESVRRGVQVKNVGSNIIAKAAPVGQGIVDNLDERNLTNPLIGVISLSLIIFMKNKLLAIFLIIGLVYLLKQRQIKETAHQVSVVRGKITGAVDRVAGAADRVDGAAENLN